MLPPHPHPSPVRWCHVDGQVVGGVGWRTDSSFHSISFSSGASVCLILEGGVRQIKRGGLRLVLFCLLVFLCNFFPSPPSGASAATQSPRMTFTKLATSVSLASWEVKKGCCWGWKKKSACNQQICSSMSWLAVKSIKHVCVGLQLMIIFILN